MQAAAQHAPETPVAGDLTRGTAAVVLDRYRLDGRLGSGGMGVVWRATDLKLGRAVAIKRIACADADSARRADREVVAAARLQHRSIVALYESVADDDAVWLVSELVDGPTFAQALAAGELSDRDVIDCGLALAGALAHAHRQGVVHRDVKPQNILLPVPVDGRAAKLTDFGIARLAGDDGLTRTGDVVGTIAYMAPEQADGRGAGPEADLYALGLCLYEGLSGVNPVRGRGVGGTARRVGRRLPALGRLRRDLSLTVCEAIDRAVLPDPAERGTLRELGRALRDGRAGTDDEPGTIAGAALETLIGPPDPVSVPARLGPRLVAGLLAAPLTALPALLLGEHAAIAPAPVAAAIGFCAVALLPRLGWVVCAALLLAALAGAHPHLATLGLLAAVPVPLLLRRAEPWSWSLPAAGAGLALIGAPLAAPALAVRISRPLHRAALGLLCAWWMVLTAVATGHGLIPGLGTGSVAGARASDETLAAIASSPALMTAAICVAAALVVPWLTGGRGGAALAGAALWAVVVAAVGAVLLAGPSPRIIAGAAIGAMIAWLLRPSRPGPLDVPLA